MTASKSKIWNPDRRMLIISSPLQRVHIPIPRLIFTPLLMVKKELGELGLRYGFQYGREGRQKADIALVDCKIFYREQQKVTIRFLETLRNRVNHIVWLDTRDAAGNTQFEVLPYVDAYWKNQIYANLSDYDREFCENRMHTDYFKKIYNLDFDSQPQQVKLSAVSEHAKKLSVSWNLGFGCHTGSSHYTEMIKRFLGNVGKNPRFVSPTTSREFDVNMRISVGKHSSYSVHRKTTIEKVRDANLGTTPTGFITKRQFLAELGNSKIAVSPFGWGEVCYRDYEAAVSGACLVKPDMSHLTTWPDIYIPYETYMPVKWDLSDFNERIQELLDDSDLRINLVTNAQKILKSVYSRKGLRKFAAKTATALAFESGQ